RELCDADQRSGRLICLFGCGGDRDRGKRAMMGLVAEKFADHCIVTSDNPRSEDPEKIIAEMKTDLSMNETKKVMTISNRHEAILKAVKLSKQGDIILCAGKGHENYQEIARVKHYLNDMEEFKQAFNME
ncbi:MAG: UDP-N-acetylmuramoyl-L-alanyl-D-glutamate--2,6-diaminopimelate ligase, partial [Candidatus Nomurabacteria bacterium]|nr:UDP-N-acetylmuramoyl-L-alanyl-D-glutamate--2,6-diaminopimelate ligase [Candidatus Nomurabacteria bacterium]